MDFQRAYQYFEIRIGRVHYDHANFTAITDNYSGSAKILSVNGSL